VGLYTCTAVARSLCVSWAFLPLVHTRSRTITLLCFGSSNFWKFLFYKEGGAATRFVCDGISNDSFIANFPDSVPVKKFGKFVEN